MDGREPCPGFIALLTQFSKTLHKRTPEALLGMRLRNFLALSIVRDREGLSQQELGEATMMDANNVVLLLNELEAAGYTIRRRDPLDRRRHLVALTDAGRKALERAEIARESIEDEVLAALTPDERKTLRSL